MNFKLGIFSPLIILAVLFTILTLSLFNNKYEEEKSLLKVKDEVLLATQISQLVHELQRERGFSAGFVSQNNHYKKLLKIQRIETDEKIKQLDNFLKSTKDDAFTKHIFSSIQDSLKKLDEISLIRELIDKDRLPIEAILDYYITLNKMFLNITFDISKFSQIPIITQNLIAYSHFLYLKEYMGRERAFGVNVINIIKMSPSIKMHFHKLLIKEELYKELFFKYASHNAIEYYHKSFQSPSIKEVTKIRKDILDMTKNTKIDIIVDKWFLNITTQIDILKDIDDYLSNEIMNNIEQQQNNLIKDISSFILLNFFSLITFISMIVIIINLVQREKNLKNLIDKYVITSTTDLKGVITDVSQAFSNISGYKKSELIGKHHNIVRDPSMNKNTFREMWYTIQSGNTWYGNIKNRNKDGSFYWVYAIVSPLYSYGKKIGYSAIRQDVTSKKKILELNLKLEEKISLEVEKNRQKDKQLIEQSRLAQMGEMLSMIAHQWRQPLNAISFSSAGLELKAQLGKANSDIVLESAQNISENVQYLSRTIDDFKDFFKPQKEKQLISCTQVIKKTLKIISPSLQHKNIEIIEELNMQEMLYTYNNELQQVILNILQNAVDVLVDKQIEKPSIKITTFFKDNSYIIEIEDNGGGISADNIEKIFNPYFSTKLEKEGTGLGLYMSKMIIEDHCLGKLSVKNINDGAIFEIKLQNLEE